MEDRLHFGPRARRKARRERRLRTAAFASMAAIALGVPGADVAFDTLDRLVGEERPPASFAGGVEATESARASLKFRRKVFSVRPTPTPTEAETGGGAAAEAPPVHTGSVADIIAAAAAEFGLSADYLIGVAVCESNLDPSAVNPAGYHGLFQFDHTTWAAYGYGSIYDPVAQARTAARLLAAGHASRWPNCA